MASLARIRLAKRLVNIYSIISFRKIIANPFFFQPLQTGIQHVRSIQTTTDTSPSDCSQPFTITLHKESFRSHNCETPELDVELTKEGLLKMYKDMQTMRRMEMAADALYKAKLVRGFCHLAIGQVSSYVFNGGLEPPLLTS